MISNIQLLNCSPVVASSHFVEVDRGLCGKHWHPGVGYVGDNTYINSFMSAAPMIIHYRRVAVLSDITYPGLNGWHRSHSCSAVQIQRNRWVGYYASQMTTLGKIVCIGTFEVHADRLYFVPRVQFDAGWGEWPKVRKADDAVEFWVDMPDKELVVGMFTLDSIAESVV